MKDTEELTRMQKPRHYSAILAIIIALFLARIAQWCMGEFWYDETLSLLLFVLKPQSLTEVFRSYPIANNHILSNAIEWLWLRMGGGGISFDEWMVRLPAIAAAVGTLLVMGLAWRRVMGERRALLATAVMAASPVFCGFAWQMRGYSLAIFLSTLTVTAGARRLKTRTIWNGLGLFLTSLLLPLVMPSAAMLPCAVALALACSAFEAGKKARVWNAIRAGVLPFTGALLGVAYYLTLWKNFVYASHEAGGWEGFWCTLGAIIGPFLLHCIVPLAAASIVMRRRDATSLPPKDATAESALQGMRRYGLWLAVASLLAIVAVLMLRIPEGRYPFPRVFLPLLPAITLGAVMPPKRCIASAKAWMALLAMVFAVGFFASWLGDRWNALSLRAAVTRQNLLCQYYRGTGDNRQLAADVCDSLLKEGRSILLIVPPIDGTSTQFYLNASAGNQPVPWYLATGVEHYAPSMMQEARQHGADVVLSARNEAEAQKMLAECKMDALMPWPEWKLWFSTEARTLWRHKTTP